MSKVAGRTFIIEPTVDPDTQRYVVDRERAHELAADLIGTLIAVGGRFEFRADRVKFGQLGREPLAETVGFVVAWENIAKLNDEPVTIQALEAAMGEPEGPAEKITGAGEDGAVVVPEDEPGEAAPEGAFEEPADPADDPDFEPECDCEGEHKPPCPFAGSTLEG